MAHKILYLEWGDACGQSGWLNADDVQPPMSVSSIGHLVKETKEYVSLSPGLTQDGQFMGYITIPKGWIRKRKTVKV